MEMKALWTAEEGPGKMSAGSVDTTLRSPGPQGDLQKHGVEIETSWIASKEGPRKLPAGTTAVKALVRNATIGSRYLQRTHLK